MKKRDRKEVLEQGINQIKTVTRVCAMSVGKVGEPLTEEEKEYILELVGRALRVKQKE